MDDLISRLSEMRSDYNCFDETEEPYYRALSEAIRLASAQPEPQWISVTERLPKEYGNYLISIHGEDEPDIGTINPNDKRGWSLCDANGFYWASDKKLIVTAWMPLPEPYCPNCGARMES